MSSKQVKENDFFAIEKSASSYLSKEIDLLTMIGSIDMFANSTFYNEETKEFYNFLINSMGEIEMLYFMKGEENLYHREVVYLVEKFQQELQKYKKK